VWEVATGKLVARLVGHNAEVLCAAMSPDGTRIASAGRDGYVRLWDTTHFENVAQLGGHTSYIYSLAWSPDGTQLVSSSGDGTVRLWDTRPLAEQVAAIRARAAAVSRIQPLVARALADARNPQDALDALITTGGLTPRERELAWQVAVGLAFPRAAAKRD
jgi:WD40 repeat protein